MSPPPEWTAAAGAATIRRWCSGPRMVEYKLVQQNPPPLRTNPTLRGLNVDAMTPRDAQNALYELKKKVGAGE